MSNLTSRFLSALAAVTILLASVYFLKAAGIYLLATAFVLVSSVEFSKILLHSRAPRKFASFFVFCCLSLFLLFTWSQTTLVPMMWFTLVTLATILFGLLFHKKFSSLENLFISISVSALGYVYIAYLAATVALMAYLDSGLTWVLFLLSVVFAGDIGAYSFGVNFGKNKLAPALSPQKSIEGSLGGLFCSTAVALGFYYFWPARSLEVFLLCGIIGGALGQAGDFFESLLKRVGGVKDSGYIMPGHGGALDRLDSVLFAAPLFYFVAAYL